MDTLLGRVFVCFSTAIMRVRTITNVIRITADKHTTGRAVCKYYTR